MRRVSATKPISNFALKSSDKWNIRIKENTIQVLLIVVASGIVSDVILDQKLSPILNKQVELSTNQKELSSFLKVLSNRVSEVYIKFNAAGIGTALSLTVFAGAGNIVDVLEYIDKKSAKRDES